MFRPTPQGLYCMSELLRVSEEAPELAVRMRFEDGSMQLGPDKPKETDRCFEFKGKTVLVVEQSLADELDGRILDAEPNTSTGQMEIFLSAASDAPS